jgi:hypothetical protein
MITIQNIEKVTKTLINKAAEIRQAVSNQIILIGNKVVQDLQLRFTDLTITGQFFPENIEYWVVIMRLGEELTWIKCPLSNLGFTRKRDELNKQEFKSDIPQLDIDALVLEIANELSLQINQICKSILI